MTFFLALIGGHCLIAQVFDLPGIEWRKPIEVTASTFEFGHLYKHPKKDRTELPGIFFLFFFSHTQKTIFFGGKMDEEKNGGKCVIEFTTQKNRNRFLEKEKVTEECMKRNRNSQKNFWIFQREFQRRNDGHFMISMTQFPWSTCIVHNKNPWSTAVYIKLNLEGSRIKGGVRNR